MGALAWEDSTPVGSTRESSMRVMNGESSSLASSIILQVMLSSSKSQKISRFGGQVRGFFRCVDSI